MDLLSCGSRSHTRSNSSAAAITHFGLLFCWFSHTKQYFVKQKDITSIKYIEYYSGPAFQAKYFTKSSSISNYLFKMEMK